PGWIDDVVVAWPDPAIRVSHEERLASDLRPVLASRVPQAPVEDDGVARAREDRGRILWGIEPELGMLRPRDGVADVTPGDHDEVPPARLRRVAQEPRDLDGEPGPRGLSFDLEVLPAAILMPAPSRSPRLPHRRVDIQMAVVHVDVPAEQTPHDRK